MTPNKITNTDWFNDSADLDWRDNRQYQPDSTKLWDILYGSKLFNVLDDLDTDYGYDNWRNWLAKDIAEEIRRRLNR